MTGDTQNGWNEWSKHVLKDLERLSEGQDQIKSDIQEVKSDMGRIAVIEDNVSEMRMWKDSVAEVYSPSQMGQHKSDIEDLKTFKTKATTVFFIVQIIITCVITITTVL